MELDLDSKLLLHCMNKVRVYVLKEQDLEILKNSYESTEFRLKEEWFETKVTFSLGKTTLLGCRPAVACDEAGGGTSKTSRLSISQLLASLSCAKLGKFKKKS